MALNTTPAEATAIHNHAALAALDIASKFIRNEEGYRNTNARFLDSLRAALAVVEAGVSVPALEVNHFLAKSWADLNPYVSDYAKLSRAIESEILGYALEAQDPESLALFKEVTTA